MVVQAKERVSEHQLGAQSSEVEHEPWLGHSNIAVVAKVKKLIEACLSALARGIILRLTLKLNN